MDVETMDALRQVIEYLRTDEQKHYEDAGRPENHIFEDVLRRAKYLGDA